MAWPRTAVYRRFLYWQFLDVIFPEEPARWPSDARSFLTIQGGIHWNVFARWLWRLWTSALSCEGDTYHTTLLFLLPCAVSPTTQWRFTPKHSTSLRSSGLCRHMIVYCVVGSAACERSLVLGFGPSLWSPESGPSQFRDACLFGRSFPRISFSLESTSVASSMLTGVMISVNFEHTCRMSYTYSSMKSLPSHERNQWLEGNSPPALNLRLDCRKKPQPIIIVFDDNYVAKNYKRHYNQIFFATTNHNLNKNLFIIISDVIYNQKRSLWL